jgi:hypothetical protein
LKPVSFGSGCVFLFTARGIAAQPLNLLSSGQTTSASFGLGPRVAEALARIIEDTISQAASILHAGYPKHQACLSQRRLLEDIIIDKDGADAEYPAMNSACATDHALAIGLFQ